MSKKAGKEFQWRMALHLLADLEGKGLEGPLGARLGFEALRLVFRVGFPAGLGFRVWVLGVGVRDVQFEGCGVLRFGGFGLCGLG